MCLEEMYQRFCLRVACVQRSAAHVSAASKHWPSHRTVRFFSDVRGKQPKQTPLTPSTRQGINIDVSTDGSDVQALAQEREVQ